MKRMIVREIFRKGELVGYINDKLEIKAKTELEKVMIQNAIISPIKIYKTAIENDLSVSFTEIIKTDNIKWIYNREYDLPVDYEVGIVKVMTVNAFNRLKVK